MKIIDEQKYLDYFVDTAEELEELAKNGDFEIPGNAPHFDTDAENLAFMRGRAFQIRDSFGYIAAGYFSADMNTRYAIFVDLLIEMNDRGHINNPLCGALCEIIDTARKQEAVNV